MQNHTECFEHDKKCDFYVQQETNIAQTSFMDVYRKQGGFRGQVPCTAQYYNTHFTEESGY